MTWLRSGRRISWLGMTLVAPTLVLAGCTSAGQSGHGHAGGPVRGGTVYWAERGLPQWIFPFGSADHATLGNYAEFQYLMYRPLYWFGQVTSASPAFNEQLSFGFTPTSANGGRTARIVLKGWRFSNGQRVDAQSVIFWMNMMMEEGEKTDCNGGPCWGEASPAGFPYDVVGFSAPDGPQGDLVTVTFDRAYAIGWLLYNALSQITPMPEAWDITSLRGRPGSGGCGTVLAGEMDGRATAAACQRVWAFDTDDDGTSVNPQMSGDLDTYGSNPLWQVVDGPWRLSSYDVSSGRITFVPNLAYSGPQRPIISKFVEVAYSNEPAALAAMTRGGLGAPDVAEVFSVDLPLPGLRHRFTLDVDPTWAISFWPVNYVSTEHNGATNPIFRQLYVRQALQLLVDQPELIKVVYRGYGEPVYGPVPAAPASPFLSPQETVNPYPFNPSRAVRLLKSHGWVSRVGSTADVCERPGTGPTDCGRGIKADTPLQFTLLYNNGDATLELAVAESSEWARYGIEADPVAESFGSLVQLLSPCRTQGNPADACAWEVDGWGGSWIYAPAIMPTGDSLFYRDAGTNAGSYDDATADRLISESEAPDYSGGLFNRQALFDYENYLAEQLPVIWQPNGSVAAYEISKNLGGVAPVNSLGTLTPEYWYWKTANRS